MNTMVSISPFLHFHKKPFLILSFIMNYRILLLCILCTLCTLQSVEAAKAKSTSEISAQESKLITLVNGERKKNRLPPLSPWKTLTQYARQHSQNMADGRVDFGHGGFESRAKSIQKAASCYSVGENVAYCYLYDDPLKKSLEMWVASPHHYENILGDYKETGIGIAYDGDGRCYITQMFAKRRP